MGFEIAFHQQRGSVRAYFAQQSVLDEQPQVVVNGSQRNGRSATPHFRVDGLRGVMSWRGNDGFIDDLTLMRGCEATLPCQVAELFVGRLHRYSC